MQPPKRQSGPHRHSAGRQDQSSPNDTSSTSISGCGARCSANPARELEAWAAAVEHVHAAGLPALEVTQGDGGKVGITAAADGALAIRHPQGGAT